MESSLLRNGGRNDAPLSQRTVLQAHSILSKALKDADRLGLVRGNAASIVEPPRITPYEARTIAWDQVTTFLERVRVPQYGTLLLLDIQTGAQSSELLRLQRQDLDLESGALSIRRAWVQLPSVSKVITVPKLRKGRVVNLTVQAAGAPSAHREAQGVVAENGNFVSCHSNGTALASNQVTQEFKQVATAAGV